MFFWGFQRKDLQLASLLPNISALEKYSSIYKFSISSISFQFYRERQSFPLPLVESIYVLKFKQSDSHPLDLQSICFLHLYKELYGWYVGKWWLSVQALSEFSSETIEQKVSRIFDEPCSFVSTAWDNKVIEEGKNHRNLLTSLTILLIRVVAPSCVYFTSRSHCLCVWSFSRNNKCLSSKMGGKKFVKRQCVEKVHLNGWWKPLGGCWRIGVLLQTHSPSHGIRC